MKSRNFLADLVTVSTPQAATEVAVQHALGTVPRGMLPISRSAPASLYESGTPWTATTVFLKSDGAGAVFRVLFFQ